MRRESLHLQKALDLSPPAVPPLDTAFGKASTRPFLAHYWTHASDLNSSSRLSALTRLRQIFAGCLPAPAAIRPFPALSLQSLCGCLDPYPAAPLSVLSTRLLPGGHSGLTSQSHRFGALKITPTTQLQRAFHSTRLRFDKLSALSLSKGSHSLMFRLPNSLSLQVAPTAGTLSLQGGQAVYTAHSSRFVTCPELRYRYVCDTSNSHGWTFTSWIAALSAAPTLLSNCVSPTTVLRGGQVCR